MIAPEYTPSPHSAFGGIIWPALPAPEAARLLAVQHQLARSQYWSADKIQRHQFRQLNRLVAHAYRTVPFYRSRLDAAGYVPERKVTPEFWRSVPILGRRDIQEAGRALLSTDIPASHGGLVQSATSGSTGMPVTVVKTGLEQFIWRAFTLREEAWQHRDYRLKLAVIRAFHGKHSQHPAGSRRENWGPPVATVYPTGPVVLLDISTGLAQQAEWLARENPDYLLSNSTNLLFLARYCREAGVSLPRLKSVRSMGEVVEPELRSICRKAWGVEVADVYSADEAGYIALQCPKHEHLHVQSEAQLIEFLDESGRQAEPGQIGRVVATPLHNFAMPLLRYELGDLAEIGLPCPCGRGLPVIKRIVGRARDFVTLPSGERRLGWYGWPDIPSIVQHQIVQKTRSDLEVRLVVRRPLTAPETDTICQAISRYFGYGFAVAFTYHNDLPRSPGGKFFVFRSEIAT